MNSILHIILRAAVFTVRKGQTKYLHVGPHLLEQQRRVQSTGPRHPTWAISELCKCFPESSWEVPLWQTAGCFEIGLSAFLARLSKIGPLLGPIKLFEYSFGILSSYSCFGPERNSFKVTAWWKEEKELGNFIHTLNTFFCCLPGVWAGVPGVWRWQGKHPSVLLGTPTHLPFYSSGNCKSKF